MDSDPAAPKQRINMTHGFMKSVIRNQIDRDNYDKEVKAKQQEKGKTHHRQNQKPKKPEIQTYVPPQRSKKGGSPEPCEFLFTLEYEHKNGDTQRIGISKTDLPFEVAQRIGTKFSLPNTFVDALTQRIQEEIDKRLAIAPSI